MRILLLGATGLVGSNALEQALAHPSVTTVIAPTRKPLRPDPKLTNPVAEDLLTLLPEVASWRADTVICATGTTMRKAGSKAVFRQVDYDLPLAFAEAAHQCGSETFALVSAMGASIDSMFFYSKIKGETERDIQRIGFQSVTIVRPGIIGGHRAEGRFTESIGLRLAGLLRPVLPKSFRINPASTIAAALINAVVSPQLGCSFRYSSSLI